MLTVLPAFNACINRNIVECKGQKCQEITKLLLGKDGLQFLDFAEIHAPYGSYGSDSSDSSKLGGMWITGRKKIVINIF